MVVVVVVVAGQSFAAKTLLFVFWHGALRGGRTTQPTSAWIESLLLLVLLMMVMVLAREFPPKRARWKRLVGIHISVFLCLALLPWWWRWPPRSRRTLLLLAVERIFSYVVCWLGGVGLQMEQDSVDARNTSLSASVALCLYLCRAVWCVM